ncbi:hypothetical protein EBU71_20535, partial [bacterium]|nr:hypothetical protein [Candidatus Elulimicrobium humile]
KNITIDSVGFNLLDSNLQQFALANQDKSLLKASHSNYSDIDMKWIVGTSYIIEDQVQNGTSVSAAIYSAFLANCIEKNDPSFLEQQINQYHNSVKI